MSESTAPVVTTTAPAEGAPPVVADVTPATPSHVQDAAKNESFAARMARAKSRFEQPAEPKIDGAPTGDVSAAKVDPVVEAKPEPATDKADAKAEASHARALAALRKAEADNLRLKGEGKATSDKLAADLATDRATLQALKTQLEAITKDPIAALKATGMTVDQFMRDVVAQKIKPPAPDDELRESMQAKLTPIEQELAAVKAKLAEKDAAEEKSAEQTRMAAAREQDLTVVRSIVTAEEYPITAALGAYDTVLAACYQSGSQDVAAKAAEFEAHQISLLENLITPKVLAALEKRSTKIRETVGALRGSSQSRQTTVSSGGPRVAARDAVSAPTTPAERPKSDAERMARAKALLNGASS